MAPPTDPSTSSHSIFEDPKHPPELTSESYELCLQGIQAFAKLASQSTIQIASTTILCVMLDVIKRYAHGVSVNDDSPEHMLQDDPELKRNIEQHDFASALNSRTIFARRVPSPVQHRAWRGELSPADKRVVVDSWQEEYKGNPDALESVVRTYMDPAKNPPKYARYAAFTQSSGTGKSRMVDELAKKILCLPLNLGGDAFPPRDADARDWFVRLQAQKTNLWAQKVQVFICVLFETALARLRAIYSDSIREYAQIAREFRRKMSEGMEFEQHGQYRREFYAEVCKRVGESEGRVDVETAARALTDFLSSTLPGGNKSNSSSQLLVILSFDEAHILTEVNEKSADTWTLFEEVRRGLHIIRKLPVFALFISTVGIVEPFSPPPQLDSSTRVVRTDLRPFEPIVITPLDVFAQRLTNHKAWTLQEVASTHHMVHLGRPLFAAMYDAAKDDNSRDRILTLAGQKLLHSSVAGPNAMEQQELACIAVRIPIEFNRVLLSDSRADASMERNLVAQHMRILLYAGIGFSPFITTSASEPFLAEAAYNAMVRFRWENGKALGLELRRLMQPFKLFTNCVWTSLFDLGPRGEIAAALLLLYARDCATTLPLGDDEPPPGVSPTSPPDAKPDEYDGASKRRVVTVLQLLGTLLGESHYDTCASSLPRAYQSEEASKKSLRDAFKEGFVYFNHFIKVQSSDVVNQEYLLLAISRGAAIICADRHGDVDVVVPVLIGTELKKDKVTAILIQARNSRHYGAKVQHSVFANMNPYRCGLFASDVEDPPPVLRMVFAFASKKSAVNRPSQGQRKSPRTKKTKNARFTAYEIWCAGATHETFGVIQEDDVDDLAGLLELLREPRDVLTQKVYSEQVRRALREMQPLVSTHADHIARFADPPSKEEYPIAEDADEGTFDEAEEEPAQVAVI